MSSSEESAAQRAARLRREKREAKIKAGGSARLDRITGLSGRTPSSAREESSPSPQLTPTPEPQAQAQPQRRPASPLPPSPNVEDQTPESIQAQEAYLRALLRSKQPIGDENAQQEDPTAKLLSSLMGGNMPGMPGGEGAAGTGSPPELSSSDLSSALGIPPSISRFFLGGQSQPATPLDKRRDQIWKFVHIVFSLVVGLYLLLIFQSSVSTYGSSPPPPATAQNPFTLFLTGEVVLTGTRMLTKARNGQLNCGVRTAISLLGDFVRDGKIAIFVLGMGLWCLRRGEEDQAKS